MAKNTLIENYTKVFVTSIVNLDIKYSWEDAIKTNINGPLYGYRDDLAKKGIKNVLYELLIENSYKDRFNSKASPIKNYNLVNPIYIAYIENKMPDDTEENKSEREKLKEDLEKLNHPTINAIEVYLKYGIIEIIELLVPYEKLTQEYAIFLGEGMYIPENNTSLYAKNLEDTEKSIDYDPLVKNPNAISSDLSLSLKICIFSKTKKKLYDITKYVNSISTTVGDSGGNFEIKMDFVSENTLENSENIYSSEDISRHNFNKILYFQSIFRENDLVFIKYELLKIEDKDKSINEVSGKYWDMIGLIDMNQVHSEAFGCNVTILGRDLSKLFIEDTNFFVPYQYANGTLHFGGYSSKLLKRLFSTGKFQLQFLYNLRSIELTIGFILAQLSNIEVLTDDCYQWLVKEYGNKLSKTFTSTVEGIKLGGGKPIYSSGNNEVNTTSSLKSENIKGIFGLIKFAVDEKVSHYRLVDSSISNPQGSLMNQFYKVAQAPFVELIFDTFGDFYYIFARRPPYDKSIQNSENVTAISIDPILSISDDLYMDTEVYTVFQYEPRGSLLGGNDNMYLAYLPMIVLDEYAKIWGNKLFKATSNYTSVEQYFKSVPEKDSIKKSPKYTYIKDLLWLVETMAYLPFTRKGQIIIRGDRRIKRGKWVYYKKTNEMFYVNSVSNSAVINSDGTVDRTTILNVSRGMIKDFIIGVEGNSYFNIINLESLEENLLNNLLNIKNKENNKENKDILPNESIVNKEVFNFFLEGNQFLYKKKNNYINEIDTISIKSMKDFFL